MPEVLHGPGAVGRVQLLNGEKKFRSGVYNLYASLYYRPMDTNTTTATVTQITRRQVGETLLFVVVDWEWSTVNYVLATTTPDATDAELLDAIRAALPKDEGGRIMLRQVLLPA